MAHQGEWQGSLAEDAEVSDNDNTVPCHAANQSFNLIVLAVVAVNHRDWRWRAAQQGKSFYEYTKKDEHPEWNLPSQVDLMGKSCF